MKIDARFSTCRRYRYALWRVWDETRPQVVIIGLNPSRADAVRNNPTINRCIAFAQSWGYGGVCLANLFAFKAGTPSELMRAEDPVGPDNDSWLLDIAATADTVVAAWGNDGAYRGRSAEVRRMIPNLCALRINKSGEPAHPLYLKGSLVPVPW